MEPKKLKRMRKREGWSQQDLAARLGVSLDTVKSWESGRRNMSRPSENLFNYLIQKKAR